MKVWGCFGTNLPREVFHSPKVARPICTTDQGPNVQVSQPLLVGPNRSLDLSSSEGPMIRIGLMGDGWSHVGPTPSLFGAPCHGRPLSCGFDGTGVGGWCQGPTT